MTNKIIQDIALSRLDPEEETYIRPSAQQLTGDLTIAEVGVENGLNALRLLKNLNIKKMYLVDWYKPNYTYTEELVAEQRKHAETILEPYRDKIEWIIADSVEAAKGIEELDYVYIDGDHSFEGVYRDIVAWYPKVKKGGIIGGHDFSCFEDCRNGIMKFVLENDLICSFQFQDWWVKK